MISSFWPVPEDFAPDIWRHVQYDKYIYLFEHMPSVE